MTDDPVVVPVDNDPAPPTDPWDVSVGLRDVGSAGTSQPYAYWPAWLATAAGSSLTTVDAIAQRFAVRIAGSSPV